jgi:hypothetical protein
VQADDHDRSYWNDLEIESQVEYRDGWFYTLDQMKLLYETEYNDGKRLSNFIRHTDGKYLAQCNGESFEIPEPFILTTLNHLQEMLDQGYVKYLFRLDTFHGHPFVSEQRFAEKYQHLSWQETIQTFVHDGSLKILYHTAEHLALRPPPGQDRLIPRLNNSSSSEILSAGTMAGLLKYCLPTQLHWLVMENPIPPLFPKDTAG